MNASILYNNSSLQQTYQFISANFDDFVQGDNFKHLSKAELLSLFTNLDCNTVQETSLYKASIDWMYFDKKHEMKFSSLFLILDLEKFTSDFVADTTAKERLIKVDVDRLNVVLSYFLDKMKSMKMEGKTSNALSVGGIGAIKTVLEVFSVSND